MAIWPVLCIGLWTRAIVPQLTSQKCMRRRHQSTMWIWKVVKADIYKISWQSRSSEGREPHWESGLLRAKPRYARLISEVQTLTKSSHSWQKSIPNLVLVPRPIQSNLTHEVLTIHFRQLKLVPIDLALQVFFLAWVYFLKQLNLSTCYSVIEIKETKKRNVGFRAPLWILSRARSHLHLAGPFPHLFHSPVFLPALAWELFSIGNQCDKTWSQLQMFKLTSLSSFPS